MKLFAYGVLQHPKILYALCGRSFSMLPATLYGYRKVFLEHREFAPCAIVTPEVGASVRGQLLLDVPESQLPLFDQFECVDQGWYERVDCRVEDDLGELHLAGLYAPGVEGRNSLGRDWDEAYFLASGRLEFLESMLLDMNANTDRSC